jgi:hypothetical protein
MADVIPARMTHEYDGELVVFLIGMRINKPWRPDLWLPVFLAMPKMLAELSKDKNSGLLGYRLSMGSGGPFVVQYWNSIEKLYAYAGSVQPPCAQGSRYRRHLARDLSRRPRRVDLLRDARLWFGGGHLVSPGSAAR